MTTAHSAVRQPSAALLGVGKPSAVFHAFEELLEIAQCQLVKGDISYTGDQLVIDQIFLVLLCCLTQFWSGVILIPEIEPGPEGHRRLYAFRNRVMILLHEALEF